MFGGGVGWGGCGGVKVVVGEGVGEGKSKQASDFAGGGEELSPRRLQVVGGFRSCPPCNFS